MMSAQRIRRRSRRVFVSSATLVLIVVGAGAVSLPAANAVTLSVNNGAGCSDSSGTPFCTITAAAARALPGDMVNVIGGTYNEKVTLTLSGTSEASRIIFDGNNGAATV